MSPSLTGYIIEFFEEKRLFSIEINPLYKSGEKKMNPFKKKKVKISKERKIIILNYLTK